MALKALVCPQCNANLQIDDSRDFGFCQYCGTKVMLHDTIEVKHTGTVKLDTSGQEENFLKLANSAFEAGNHGEAYVYYTKVLEVNADNAIAIYMKGICAAYDSDSLTMRTNEYVQAVNKARSVIYSINTMPRDNVLKNIEQQSIALADYWLTAGKTVQPASMELGDCISQFSRAKNVADLVLNIIRLLSGEAAKESLINRDIEYINNALRAKLKYFAGYTTDKKGNRVPVYKYVTATADQQKALRQTGDELADEFNNLPSRLEKSGDIGNRMESAESDVERLEAEMKGLKSERNSKRFELLKDRKNAALKEEISALNEKIDALSEKLDSARSVLKGVSRESKEFKKSMK